MKAEIGTGLANWPNGKSIEAKGGCIGLLLSKFRSGVGLAMTCIAWFISLSYYASVAIADFALFSRLMNVPPWSSCDNAWSNPITFHGIKMIAGLY